MSPILKIPPRLSHQSVSCPNGGIAVIAGQTVGWDTGIALARPLSDANGEIDTRSATQSLTLTRGGATRAIATDNQIVRQKDGSLLAIRNSCIWDEFTNNPPAWADELVTGVGNHRGQRGSIHVYRSTDCGETWVLYSVIDFGTFLDGRYGLPRPADDAGSVIDDLSTTRQGRYPDGSLKWFVGGSDRRSSTRASTLPPGAQLGLKKALTGLHTAMSRTRRMSHAPQ
jgi:hypothetical protein